MNYRKIAQQARTEVVRCRREKGPFYNIVDNVLFFANSEDASRYANEKGFAAFSVAPIWLSGLGWCIQLGEEGTYVGPDTPLPVKPIREEIRCETCNVSCPDHHFMSKEFGVLCFRCHRENQEPSKGPKGFYARTEREWRESPWAKKEPAKARNCTGGHLISGRNIVLDKRGRQRCRKCKNEHKRLWAKRRRGIKRWERMQS